MTSLEKIQVHEKSIEELRRMHEEVCDIYKNIRTKTITFLGGGLALLSFLYGGGDLFIPKEIYGRIFYSVGFVFYMSSLFLLFLAAQPVLWRLPTKIKKHKEMKFSTYLEFLVYIKNEYTDALNINFAHNEKKQKYLNSATVLLASGAILLLIIKSFGKESL